jgi:glutaredoxin-dependent peroxiredoxin
MSATVGQKAPDFQLPDQDKKMVTLSASIGKNVVLLFFPAAFTSTCTKELCQTRDELSFFDNLNAEVYGISVDMPFTLNKFRADNNLNFSLLSDFNKDAITAYGCKYDTWILGLKGVAKRSSFVIDKEGIIRFAEILENASDYPNFDGIKKALEELK